MFPDPKALEHYLQHLEQFPANPSSLHQLGQVAAHSIRQSKEELAALTACRPDEFYLTSGGSESINWAIKGYVNANPKRGRTIITSAGEHQATRETLLALARQGFKIIEIALDSQGVPDLAALEQAINDDTILITMLWVNNETGSVLPVDKLVEIRNRKRPLTAIHLDAVQAFGKIEVSFLQSGVEMLSGSGHKFGTPKGIGFLIKKQNIRLEPLIHGGGQQNGQRGGTENEAAYAVLAYCLQQASARIAQNRSHCQNLQAALLNQLKQTSLDMQKLSPESGIPHILNLAFPGLRGETLQHALETAQIYCSTGSACSSHHKGPSKTLLAMGFSQSIATCSVRLSFHHSNTLEEIDVVAKAMIEAVQKYQRSPRS